MQVSKAELRDVDYENLFTKDPGYFIESIIVEIIYAEEPRQDVIARQRMVFNKWLNAHDAAAREQLVSRIRELYTKRLRDLLTEAEKRGQVAALSNLPLKKYMGKEIVDLTKVTETLRRLR